MGKQMNNFLVTVGLICLLCTVFIPAEASEEGSRRGELAGAGVQLIEDEVRGKQDDQVRVIQTRHCGMKGFPCEGRHDVCCAKVCDGEHCL